MKITRYHFATDYKMAILSDIHNALMDLDDDFSFRKKYSLVNDVLVMAKNMYDYMLFAHNIASIELDFDDSVSITKYDEIGSRLSCKYIRNGISLLKLFHVLVLLRISPFYSDDVHDIADKLISQLREPLFDKRIIKIVVDSNIYGENPKPHKTTRLKILFALGNSDRYCIRLDFPHDGENCMLYYPCIFIFGRMTMFSAELLSVIRFSVSGGRFL